MQHIHCNKILQVNRPQHLPRWNYLTTLHCWHIAHRKHAIALCSKVDLLVQGLGLAPALCEHLEAMNFNAPTRIQQATIPVLLVRQARLLVSICVSCALLQHIQHVLSHRTCSSTTKQVIVRHCTFCCMVRSIAWCCSPSELLQQQLSCSMAVHDLLQSCGYHLITSSGKYQTLSINQDSTCRAYQQTMQSILTRVTGDHMCCQWHNGYS